MCEFISFGQHCHSLFSAESETSADKISSSVAVVKNKYTELPPEVFIYFPFSHDKIDLTPRNFV